MRWKIDANEDFMQFMTDYGVLRWDAQSSETETNNERNQMKIEMFNPPPVWLEQQL